MILAEQAEKQQKRRSELGTRPGVPPAANTRKRRSSSKGFSYEEERAALGEQKAAELGAGNYLAFLEEKGKARPPQRGVSRPLQGRASQPCYSMLHPEAEELLPLIQKYTALSRDGADLDDLRERRSPPAKRSARRLSPSSFVELEKKGGLYRAHLERLSHLQETGRSPQSRSLPPLLPRPKTGAEKRARTSEDASTEKKRDPLREACRPRARRAGAERLGGRISERGAAIKLIRKQRNAPLRRAEERAKEALLAGVLRRLPGKRKRSSKSTATAKPPAQNSKPSNRRTPPFHRPSCKALSQEDLDRRAPKENAAAAREELSCTAQQAHRRRRRRASRPCARRAQARGRGAFDKKRVLEAEAKKAAKRGGAFGAPQKAPRRQQIHGFRGGGVPAERCAKRLLAALVPHGTADISSVTKGAAAASRSATTLNGGRTRGVYTLSGGETFLVSLSLALSLSQEICLRSLRPIEFFFLDEGFGTLDEHLVDTVMDSLERLKGEHFSIGIISHVEELKHRIEKKAASSKKATETHGSQIIAE